MLSVLLFVALATTGFAYQDNELYGIAYIALTVDNLDLATRFYTEVMDGREIQEFRGRNIQGDEHYYRMFQKEILDARQRRVSPQSIGVPDIRKGGQHRVNWNFILFDNSLLWLMEFVDGGSRLSYKDPARGSAKIGYAHMAFWAEESINPYQMMKDMYDKEVELRLPYYGFSSTEDESSYSSRNQKFQSSVEKFVTPELDGFRLAATMGTVAEKVELGFRRGKAYPSQFSGFCQTGSVHTAMLSYSERQIVSNKYKEKSKGKSNGMHHVSVTIPDTQQAIDFYSTVLGGKTPSVGQPSQLPPFYRNMILQDDILLAQQQGSRLNADYGFVDINLGDPNSGTVEISFINFDNYYLETYKFNPRNQSDALRLVRQNTSPGYIGRIHPGFWVKEKVSMASFIRDVESRAAGRGYKNVVANRAVDVNQLGQEVAGSDYSRSFTSGSLRGFDYVFMKGPGGEQISFAKFTDEALLVLRRAMLEYGAVSTAFTETNPYTWGGFDDTCGDLGITPPEVAPPEPPGPPGPPGPGPDPGPDPAITRPSVKTTRPPILTTRPAN